MTVWALARRPARTRPTLPRAVRLGARDAVPVMAGYLPFALALGAALAASDVASLTAWSSSWLIFGGAAQLVTVQMLSSGAAALPIVATALVINSRHLLYSASIATHARDWPARWRLGGAYLLADPVFALAFARFERHDLDSRGRRHYLLGVGVVCWAAWNLLVVLGMAVGQVLPSQLPLGLVTALTFLLLLLPSLLGTPHLVAAAVGGVVAVLCVGLPLGLNLVVGAVAGVAAGLAVGGRRA